jgi:protein-L-isoaspartate(D-aspartate) O-methyltransferase
MEFGYDVRQMRLRTASTFLFSLIVTTACGAEPSTASGDAYGRARAAMVQKQIAARDVRDRRVLEVMGRVPRHEFVPAAMKVFAYDDGPLPIGKGQTISQPYIVAYMTEQLAVKPGHKVLEIGTGSGYQAAVLAELAKDVYSIEIVPELAAQAEKTLQALGYKNVHVRAGDGYRGWPDHAPFDGIIVTAAPDHIPPALLDQLALGGRMIIPVGDYYQEMTVVTKTRHGLVEQKTLPVRFVPMTGEAMKK